MIKVYIVASKDGTPWATCLDLNRAKKLLDLANRGAMSYVGWRGREFEILVTENLNQGERLHYST